MLLSSIYFSLSESKDTSNHLVNMAVIFCDHINTGDEIPKSSVTWSMPDSTLLCLEVKIGANG
jgi:hypothetical protein